MRPALLPPLAALVLAQASCADLPPGWDGADGVSLSQDDCSTSSGSTASEITTSIRGNEVDVMVANARFRCEQRVEGYVRFGTEAVDLLLQPEEMDPGSVAKCDCGYLIRATLPLASGHWRLTVWRRGDNASGSSTPVALGAVDLLVL